MSYLKCKQSLCTFLDKFPVTLVLFTVTLVSVSHSLTAQVSTLPDSHSAHHRPASAVVIKGAEHPELIPDSTAYRLVFIDISEDSTATQARKSRQLAYLNKAGLQDSDVQSAIDTLATFKAQYAALMANYNQSVLEANASGTQPDLSGFLTSRDSLVQYTCDTLKVLLTPAGMANLIAYVQGEKKNMVVAGGTQ